MAPDKGIPQGQGRFLSQSGWAPGIAVSSIGQPENQMRPWAFKGNDLEIGTYPDKVDLSLVESRCKGGGFPTCVLGPVGKTAPSVGKVSAPHKPLHQGNNPNQTRPDRIRKEPRLMDDNTSRCPQARSFSGEQFKKSVGVVFTFPRDGSRLAGFLGGGV